MSDPVQMRNVLNALLPEGNAFAPVVPGNPLDEFLEGLAEALQLDHNDFQTLAYIRNPLSTPFLSDLEREYGITPSAGATIAQRQAILAYHKTARGLSGQWWVLQDAINAAGFTGVNVIPNDPAVNPAQFFGSGVPQSWCGGVSSVCGYFSASSVGGIAVISYRPTASTYLLLGPGQTPGDDGGTFRVYGPMGASYVAQGGSFSITLIMVPSTPSYSQYILLGPGEKPGNDPLANPSPGLRDRKAQAPPNASYVRQGGSFTPAPVYGAFCTSQQIGGQLIVNGQQYQNAGAVQGCGSGIYCGPIYVGTFSSNECGAYIYARALVNQYGPPQDPGRFGLVFFIAGQPTFDNTGHVLTMTFCNVPAARVQELTTLILRYKPLHTWCTLLMNAV